VTARHSFVERVIGVLSLREDMMREVVEDATANQQAIRALVIGGVGPALGAMFVLGAPALPFFFVLGTVVWCLYGFVVYLLATKLFAAADTEANFGAFARGIAFAGLPRIIQMVTFNEILSVVFGVIGVAWTVAATVIAARLALKLSSQRAAASALVGAAVLFVITAILGG
jgi:hypothetical protein